MAPFIPWESPPLVIIAMRRLRPSSGGGGVGADIVEVVVEVRRALAGFLLGMAALCRSICGRIEVLS